MRNPPPGNNAPLLSLLGAAGCFRPPPVEVTVGGRPDVHLLQLQLVSVLMGSVGGGALCA